MRLKEGWALAASVATVLGFSWPWVSRLMDRGPAARQVQSAEATVRRLFTAGALNFSVGLPGAPESGGRWLQVEGQSALVSYQDCQLRIRSLFEVSTVGGPSGAYETETDIPMAEIDRSSVQVRREGTPGSGPNFSLLSVRMFTREARPSVRNRILRRSELFHREVTPHTHQADILVPDEENGKLLAENLQVLISSCEPPEVRARSR